LRLDTERLILRPFEPGDAEDIHAVYSDPSVFEYLGSSPAASIEETMELIELTVRRANEQGFALGSVVERASGRVIGDCGLQRLEGGPDVELGYRFGSSFWGRGFATEAGAAWLDYGFRARGLERIVAVTRPANVASRRVMEKLGMTLVGPGHHYGADTIVYELTRAEFEAQAG
jgi:RimJ/RimL family protein N-acetyltransferase